MDPLLPPAPPGPHLRGRVQQQQPLPNRQRPNQANHPPPQYPYNPTLHDLTNHNNPNGLDSIFRNASVTKGLLLFTVIFYFLQQNNQSLPNYNVSSSTTTTTSSSIYYNKNPNETSVWNIILRPYSNSIYLYILSKIIFFTTATKTSTNYEYSLTTTTTANNNNTNKNTTTVILIMNVLYQFYIYRIFERQMSSYQFIRYIGYLIFSSIIIEYIITYSSVLLLQQLYMNSSSSTSIVPLLLNIIISSSSFKNWIHGPYMILGALSYDYHQYIPRIYPKFVTLLSVIHFSDKSLFYFYIMYFIILQNNNNITTMNTHQQQQQQHIILNFLYTYRNSIHIIISMSLGILLSSIYVSISNHPIIVQCDQYITNRIIQQLPMNVQQYFNSTAATTTNHRTQQPAATTNRNHPRGAVQQQPQPPVPTIIPPQLRQRYQTATAATAAAMAAMDQPNSSNNNNPWRIPGTIQNENGDENMTDHNLFGGGANATATASTTIPLLPIENVDDTAIEQLCNMGFERPSVIMALRQTHNNIEHAANRLLLSSDTSED